MLLNKYLRERSQSPINMHSLNEDIGSVNHKIIFFFMPESIVFNKPDRHDDVDEITLKSISPYFYWCSAHEFPDFEAEYKYLFQYQIYSVEGAKIVPGEIIQKWRKNKNQIREDIMLFIEQWNEHKRILTAPENNKQKTNESFYNKIYDFNGFAQFVAKSIIGLQNLYIKQASIINFDILQKEYWKMIAMNKDEFYDTIPDLKTKNKRNSKKSISKKPAVKKKKKHTK
jgi:hypothetical protein